MNHTTYKTLARIMSAVKERVECPKRTNCYVDGIEGTWANDTINDAEYRMPFIQ